MSPFRIFRTQESQGTLIMDVNMDRGPTSGHNSRSTEGRETWGKKIDFLLSVIGFCVDLGNVWRFPYMCYKNGGGAFLIPYCVMLVFGGIPLFYLELALGQYNQSGAITVWDKVCPIFKGIGYAMVLVAFFVDWYYNVIISYAIYYFIASFSRRVPWSVCDHDYNTKLCFEPADGPQYFANVTTVDDKGNTLTEIVNKTVSATTEYYERGVLQMHKSDGLENLGTIVWPLLLSLLAVYVICYFSLWKGIKGSGKVVWFTATFPYVVLFCLLIRGVTLDGSAHGIAFYLKPNITKLGEAQVWVDAATQVYFSLGPGFGVLLAFSSYNQFNNNIQRDAILTSLINCGTSFLSGFVVFSVLGYMSVRNDIPIEKVATEGPGLVFVTYPEALATMPGSTVWSLLFFLMLITLGLDSSFGGTEAILTALSDQFPRVIKAHREIAVFLLFAFYMLVGLAFTSQGGTYLVFLFDNFAAQYAILTAVFFEAIAVSWFYGLTIPTERISRNIEEMIGSRPAFFWRICWLFICPTMIIVILTFGLMNFKNLKLDDYTYPDWSMALGWLISCTSIAFIPLIALYKFLNTPGTAMERVTRNLKTPPQWPEGIEMESRINGIVPEDKPVTDV
ncbi:sodium-dependent dopamine transporter-like isoform X3 [Apostichopus japonicus]|uniref:sodium-dependent dopamine transporter-like isoform X3 n=1 Tax=Stichopus japonicus TaxID=307972 RepID=UPI003AB61ABE